MGIVVSLLAVIALCAVAYLGVAGLGLEVLFGVALPYLAVLTFFGGVVWRVVDWARSPVPFRIPTTAGQQASMDWIKQNKVDNPDTAWGVLLRMFLEVVTFRSLFRNTKLDYREGPVVRYDSEKLLWLFALLFHYSFLTVLLRHLRFFLEPVPVWVAGLEWMDGFMQVMLPNVLLSGVILFAAAGYLLNRRVMNPQIRYISLPADYFPLFLIMGIALTGIAMRYLIRVDVVRVKELTMSLVQGNPHLPEGFVSPWVYVHIFLVSVLFAYFPFSKLVHMAGVFMSPTRNLASNNRRVHHENPWNPPKKFHTYAAYENDFREEMVESGLPVDKPLETADNEA